MEAASTPAYSRADMLAEGARVAGHPVSYRLLVDWVELGLVPAPNCIYPGWAKGRRGLWTAAGLDLWLSQLRNRRNQVPIGSMCNLPVGIWVYYDANPIQMIQVRRALETWGKRATRPRNGAAARNASDLIRKFGHQPVSRKARKKLVELLEGKPWRRSVDRARLRHVLAEVIAPGQSGGSGAPLTARWVAGSSAQALVERWVGTQQLPAHDDATRDRKLLQARMALGEAAIGYEQRRQGWSTHPVYGRVFRYGGIGQRIGASCGELTQWLGKLALHEGVIETAG